MKKPAAAAKPAPERRAAPARRSARPSKEPLWGLTRSHRYPWADWKSEVDYSGQLSEEERLWLSDFSEAHFQSGSAAVGEGLGMSRDQIRAAWRDFKAAQGDALNWRASSPAGDEAPDAVAPWDHQPTRHDAGEDALIAEIDGEDALAREAEEVWGEDRREP